MSTAAPDADPASDPRSHEAPEPEAATHAAEDDVWETAGDDAPHLRGEVEALRARVQELEGEVAALKDRWLRARADYDNLARRTQQERETLTTQAAGRVIEQLLEPLDILGRAAAAAEGHADARAEGLRLTHRRLWQALEREGLEEVPGVGASFDVALHEAVASEPSDAASGTITEVIRAGYRLRGRLLRAALVKVSAGPAERPKQE